MVKMGVGSLTRLAWGYLCKYNNLVWKGIFTVQLLVVVVVTMRLTTVLLGSGLEWGEFNNDYCMQHTNQSIPEGPITGTHTSEDCVYDYKFKKVVYFWCDGISWDTATPIFDKFTNNSQLFKVKHRENPWSAWVFATSVTGKADRNMGKVVSDNLIYQFFKAGLKLFLGVQRGLTTYVFNQLDLSFQPGGDDTVRFYDSVNTDGEDRMFGWFFGCGQDCVNNKLDNAKSQSRSMFLESFILDHVVHLELSKYAPKVLNLRNKLAEDMQYVKNWVDQNPDYLLVLVSDHGQVGSSAESQIHGNWLTDGNEGWMMFYSPQFGGFSISQQNKPVTLETVDMAPTFWQFFAANGVSIPAENAGRVHPITKSALSKYKALKTNAIQIRKYIEKEKMFKYSEADWIKANKQADEGNYEGAANTLDDYVKGFTNKYYKEGARIPWEFPIFVACVTLIATIVIQYRSFRVLGASIRAVGVGILMSPFIAWIILAIFFAQASDRKLRHQVYVYVIPLCSFIASYTLKRMSTLPPDFERPQNKFELLERNEIPSSSYDDNESTSSDESEDSPNYIKNNNGVEETQFLYVEVIDRLRERKFLTAIATVFNFIIGNKQVNRSSIDYWLLHALLLFGVFSSFEISFATKRFIFEDIGGLYKHPPFIHGMAVIVLFVEFRWQRILLTSHLHINRQSFNWFQQIFHTSFLPLHLKMIGYYILLKLAFEPDHATARIVYGVTFAHIAILMLCPYYFQRDLLLPMFVLTFMVNTPQEKILLCFYVLVLIYFSNSLDTPNPYNRYVVPSLAVILFCFSHFYFAVLYDLPYNIDQLNLKIPGIEDITKYPRFSVLMMGVHYVGVFIMLIPFMIRLITPVPPMFTPFRIGRLTIGYVPLPTKPSRSTPESVVNRRVLLTFLTFCTCLTAFLYYIFSMDTVSDTPLIWCFMICTITIGYGVSVVGNEMMDGLVQFSKLVIYYIRGSSFSMKDL